MPLSSSLFASMKRLWLLFTQVVTVLLGIYFVVATLQPNWLQRNKNVRSNAGIALIEAPKDDSTHAAVGERSKPALHTHSTFLASPW